MTLEDYISLLESPLSVDTPDIQDLRALLGYAPYCASARLLLLKALSKAHDISYPNEVERTLLYADSNQSVYQLIYPRDARTATTETSRHSDGNYFDMVEHMEEVAQRTGTTFAELARRFKEARMLQMSEREKQATTSTNVNAEAQIAQKTAQDIQKCIKNNDFLGAIEILRAQNLADSKKSSTFAVQMRFLQHAMSLQEGKIPDDIEMDENDTDNDGDDIISATNE